MTPDELKDMLAPIRLPAEFATFGPRDAFVAFLLGIFLSLALRTLLGPLFVRKETQVSAVRRRIAVLSRYPGPERILGLAALLQSVDPKREHARPAGLEAALYDPRASIDPAMLERAVLDAALRLEMRK